MGRIISYIIALIVGGFFVIATTESAIHSMFPPYPLRPMSIGLDVVIFMLIGHLILAYIPASIAGNKGHSIRKWFVYGFFLPPIAMVHSILTEDYEKEYRTCPFCAERVKKKAKICRFCGHDITSSTQVNNKTMKDFDEISTQVNNKTMEDSDEINMIHSKYVLLIVFIVLIVVVIMCISNMFVKETP